MLEIIAKVKKIGAISVDRKQVIELEDVALMSGDFCEGEIRSIFFLTAQEQKKVLATSKSPTLEEKKGNKKK